MSLLRKIIADKEVWIDQERISLVEISFFKSNKYKNMNLIILMTIRRPQKMTYKILVINPGSTSTKIAIFNNNDLQFEEVLRHPAEELEQFKALKDQYGYRKDAIENFLKEKGIEVKDLSAVAARGGIINPIPGGTYQLDEELVEALSSNMVHASNLAGMIAYEFTTEFGMPSFIKDPVSVDEMDEIARVTGVPGIKRQSKFHALNQKAVARRIAKQLHKNYEDCNFIVAHMGGGVSIGAHHEGRVIDVNNVIDGDGPLSPNRAGALPVGSVIDLCFSGEYTHQELKEFVSSKAGLWAYLGTSDTRDVQAMIEAGNEEADLLYKAFAYQVAKNIGSMATVLKGEIDAIILTGGIAYSAQFVRMIKERVDFLGEVIVAAGEDEMLALAEGAFNVLKGEEEAKKYRG